MPRVTIRNVLDGLTDKQRERLAASRPRAVRAERLAQSYQGDWVSLVRDLSGPEIRRALALLPDDELRIVALRAFDGRRTGLEDMGWRKDGAAPQRRRAKGIVEALCMWAPKKLQERTWNDVIVKMLRDVGIECNNTPKGNEDLVQLRRIFR